MASRIRSAALVGLDAQLVDVETDVTLGLPNFLIVGLPDAAVQEARERVRSSIKHTGLQGPRHKVIVNLAPADLKKEGPGFDVPIAISVLVASGDMPPVPDDHLFIGELSLDGSIRPVPGVLSIAFAAQRSGMKAVFVPAANADEAALVQGVSVYGVRTLRDIVDHVAGASALRPWQGRTPEGAAGDGGVDLSAVIGQENAKRALEIAAAGGHNVLLSGPPGSGKTLLAKAFTSILPPLSLDELLEVTQIYSVAGQMPKGEAVMRQRPFRSPHHTASSASIVGGGANPRPGEITLAHRGVLFLDEFPEFPRSVLEALREPLEDGTIVVARAAGSLRFPASLTLIAAMNPCPCGFLTDPERQCLCSPHRVLQYQKKLSGPLLDRIDLHVSVPRLSFEALEKERSGQSSAVVRNRVVAARQRQAERFRGSEQKLNKDMSPHELRSTVRLDDTGRQLLKQAVHELQLSARAYHRVLKVSRTIADLAGTEAVEAPQIAEALQYRGKTM